MAGGKMISKSPRNLTRRGRCAYRRSGTIHGAAKTRHAVMLMMVAIVCLYQIETVTTTDDCQRRLKPSHTHLEFDREVTSLNRVAFTVKTDKEAIIGLSPSSLGVDPVMYKIVIGKAETGKSEVQRCQSSCSSWVMPVAIADILSPTESRGFWIDWGNGNGLIKVGRRGEETPFMERTEPDPSPIAIRYLGYATGASSGESTWNFCGESDFCRCLC
ncbi:uncharacterized protein LOC110974433 [Acanthaster planci]|uniref:Uncharacterized protein LOC110974433 n=1 Tax=Acanthaster planci TaxID=133434 RepID=A0A8B7XNJ9_ACAPL|nr:uncharacterized protein LOC110974433 [Acanthaster planci]